MWVQKLSSGQTVVCADYLGFDIITLSHFPDAESPNVRLDCRLLLVCLLLIMGGGVFFFPPDVFTSLGRWHSLVYMHHVLVHTRHVKQEFSDSVLTR